MQVIGQEAGADCAEAGREVDGGVYVTIRLQW